MSSEPVDPEGVDFGPWNPGIRSQVPDELLHLSTIFRPENVFTSVAEAAELRDLTGLELAELTMFRPQRLALHELMLRVTANISVPDGSRIEDLGINFRRITRVLLDQYLAPHADEIEAAYRASRQAVERVVAPEVDALFAAPAASLPATRSGRGFFARLRGGGARPDPPPSPPEPGRQLHLVADWEREARSASDPCTKTAYRVLARVVAALLTRHGELWGNRELVASLATNLACNSHASDAIGQLIEPWILDAARREGLAILPRQDHPIVMNTKGASASGKSTLRPLQKTLARDIGVDWSDFALISPDIWRKQLLDYATLGPVYKYGGAFTGEEVQIIDRKLDRYMARKAERGDMSHLLIDRFRFDSFAADSDEAGSNLLTRFGQTVYLFFMITPPASLVERAWNRGLEVGRYKAVDDTLAHAVEAYSGMPQLFFTWVQRVDKSVNFEFLDNSVAQGSVPRTVAFGSNDTLNVLDVGRMLDVERFRKLNLGATRPADLYPEAGLLAPGENTGFLRGCIGRFRTINFAEHGTGRVYLQLRGGDPAWCDPEGLARAVGDPEALAGIAAVAPAVLANPPPPPASPLVLQRQGDARRSPTLGAWGTRSSPAG